MQVTSTKTVSKFLSKKKGKRKEKNDEIEKTAKGKCRFRREEKLGPQASSRVTPCPPAPNHTRGEVIRPPSQIKNNSYSMIWTRDLDDLSCTRARLRLPLDHHETTYLISINCRCREFWNIGLGGRVRNFVWLRVQSSVSGQDWRKRIIKKW